MPSPSEDPTFLAFQRASGLANAQDLATSVRKKSRIQQEFLARQPGYALDREQGQRAVTDNFLGRGVYGSGVMAERQNEANREVDNRVLRDVVGVTGDMQDVDAELASAIARRRAEEMERSLQSRSSTAIGNAKGILDSYS